MNSPRSLSTRALGVLFSSAALLSLLGATLGAPAAPAQAAQKRSTSTVAPGTSMATPGYWLADASGQVGSYGGVPFRSSLQSAHVDAPVVDLAPTNDGNGYWLAGSDGGVFAFGDAGYFGSLAGQKLNAHVVGLAATANDHGYWLAAADGGVFAYGDARFAGSLAGKPLEAPIVGAAATRDGGGYWLVAADGGVFAFGDAHYLGSLSTTTLHEAVVGIAPTPDGAGYWLAAADGGVFAFGDAKFRGSASGNVPSSDPVVAVASGPGVASDYAAGNFAATATPATPAGPSTGAGTEAPGAVGYDISWPQCNAPFPAPSTLAIVGINDGTAFTTNPCFDQEAAWAGLNLSVYINLNAPDPTHPEQFANGPAGPCAPGASACDSYNYGYNAATNAVENVFLHGYAPHQIWLDVETSNIWSADTWLNDQVISGAISALQHAGATPGLYSTGYQYSTIAGSFRASVPEWLATGVGLTAPAPGCATPSFTGGRVTLVQGILGSFDGDFAC